MGAPRRIDEDSVLRAALDATFERTAFVDILMGVSIRRHQYDGADRDLGHTYSDCLALVVAQAAQWKIAHGGDVYDGTHREGFWLRTLTNICLGERRHAQGTTTALAGEAAALLDALRQVSKR